MPAVPLLFAVTESNTPPQHCPTRIPVSAFFDESTLRITTQHDWSSPMPTAKLRILPFAIAIDSKWPPPSEIPSPVPLPVIVWPFMSSETPSSPIVMQVPDEVRFFVRK